MREAISSGLMWTGFVAAVLATGYYMYFMWGLDWGRIFTRGYGLDLILTMFGSIVIFVAVWGIFAAVASKIDN